MFKFFKRKKSMVEIVKEARDASPPVCNCGEWPNPSWTPEMFVAKAEKVKLCPVHKYMQMVMIATPRPVPIQMPVASPVMDGGEVGTFKDEMKCARIHMLNIQEMPECSDELWDEAQKVIDLVESTLMKRPKP